MANDFAGLNVAGVCIVRLVRVRPLPSGAVQVRLTLSIQFANRTVLLCRLLSAWSYPRCIIVRRGTNSPIWVRSAQLVLRHLLTCFILLFKSKWPPSETLELPGFV